MADAYSQFISKITRGTIGVTDTDPGTVLYTDTLPDLSKLTADLLSEVYNFVYFSGTVPQLLAITDYSGHLQTQTEKFLQKYPLDDKLEAQVYARNLLVRSLHSFLLPYDLAIFAFYANAFRTIANNQLLATTFQYLTGSSLTNHNLQINRFYIVDFFLNLGTRIDKITRELEKLEKALAKLGKSLAKPITLTETARLLALIKLEYKNPENVRRLLRQYDKKLQRRVQWCHSCAKQLLNRIEQLKSNNRNSPQELLNLYSIIDQGLCVYSTIVNDEINEHLKVIRGIITENPLFATTFLITIPLTPFGLSLLTILSAAKSGTKNFMNSLADFKMFMTNFELALRVNPALGPARDLYAFLTEKTTNINAIASVSAYVYNTSTLLYNLLTKATSTDQPEDYVALFCNAATRLVDLLLFLTVSTPDSSVKTSQLNQRDITTTAKQLIAKPSRIAEPKSVSKAYATANEIEQKAKIQIDPEKVVNTRTFIEAKNETTSLAGPTETPKFETTKPAAEITSQTQQKNKPSKLLFLELTDEIVLPTTNENLEPYEKKISFRLVDQLGQELSNDYARELTIVTDQYFPHENIKIGADQIKITNAGLTTPGTFKLSFVNANGEKLGELPVIVKPLQRVIKRKEIKAVKYNLFVAELQIEDGNGNPADGQLTVIVNDTLEEELKFKNGQAKLSISPHSLSLWSLKAKLNPSIDEINYHEPTSTVELIDNALYAQPLSARAVKRLRNISALEEEAYQPAISPTGNYLCYLSVRNGATGLVVYDINTGHSWNVLSTDGITNAHAGQQTVQSYLWLPSKDILIFTCSTGNTSQVDAYIPTSKKRKNLYMHDTNANLHISVDTKAKLAVWIADNTIMSAEITNQDDISFNNPTRVFQTQASIIGPAALSPDATYVVYIIENNLHCYNLKTGKIVQLTNSLLPKSLPAWSPDGKYIAYYEKSGTNYALYLLDFQTVNRQSSPERKQVHNNVAISFGKPVWLSNTELAFGISNPTSASNGPITIAVYNTTTNSISHIDFKTQKFTTCAHPTVSGQLKDGEYKILIACDGFDTELGKQQVYLGELE